MFDWIFNRLERPPVPLVLYGRKRCAACVDMKDEIRRARLEWPYSLTEIDVEHDRELEREFGASIPILWIGGRQAFKVRMNAADFEKKFEALAIEWWRARALSEDIAAHEQGGSR